MTQSTKEVNVAQSGTLVLLASTGNPFNITLHARVPSTGAEGDGEAIPQNDVFGYFTLPTLVPNTTGVPEVFVKMLDARPIPGQDFWFFWGGLTDLDYTVTVTDTVRGTVKTYTNPAASVPGQGTSACLGADTNGFAPEGGATPTPTVSAGPTPTPTPGVDGVRIVNVGAGGNNAFVDSQSGTHTTNIRVGQTVQWNWMAGPHTSTSGTCRDSGGAYGGYDCTSDGNWSSGSHSSGEHYSKTFTQAGTYKYYCEVHGYAMTATVVVSAQ
jgi:plastocyanin